MKTAPALSAVALLIGGASLLLAAPAFADDTSTVAVAESNDRVCDPLDSGKIDVDGEHKTVVLTAPAGKLITGYCVKAGSVKQGNGPKYFELEEPVASLTIAHPSGKDISHYSYSYAPIATPTATPTPEPTPDPTPDPTPTHSGPDAGPDSRPDGHADDAAGRRR